MWFVFLNLTVISLVYTEKFFSLAYLLTCFTVGNAISKSYMLSYYLNFFHSLFSHWNFLGIYWENFLIGIYRWIQRYWKILLVKVITIYQKKKLIVFMFIFINFLVLNKMYGGMEDALILLIKIKNIYVALSLSPSLFLFQK